MITKPSGQRIHWMDLQGVTTATDGDGSYTTTASDLTPSRVRAAKEPGRPLESVRDGTVTRTATYKITMPYHPDVVAGIQIRDGDRTYRVMAAYDPDGSRRETIAECVERI